MLAQIVVIVQGVARRGDHRHRRGGRARALGRAVAGLVQLAARGLFRLRGRRRHAVAVVDADRRRACSASSCSSPGSSRTGSPTGSCRRRASTRASAIRSARSRLSSAATVAVLLAGGPDRARRAEARHRRRRAVGRHRLRPAVDRQQFRLRPHSPVGARHPGRRLGDGRDRSGLRPPDQRARDRDRDLRPGDGDRAELEPRHAAWSRTG